MIDLCYKLIGSCICLYKIEDGNKIFIKQFRDREDLLIYIEQNYDCANLMIMR